MAEQDDWLDWLRSYGEAGATAASDSGSGLVVDLPSHEEPAEPDRHVEHDTLSYETEPIRKQARKDFPDEFDIFINLWLTAATGALAGAPEVDEPESEAGWWVALGGNLLWAATCLVPPAKAIQITLMSFGGAIAGSGGFGAVLPKNDRAPSGKQLISKKLTQARDAMRKKGNEIMDLSATQCGDKGITDKEEQRKTLWRNLFSTPYDEADPIRELMSGKIEAALASYNQQWHKWKKEIASLAGGYANEAQSSDMDATGRGVDKSDYERAMKEHPFTPQLTF